MMTSNESNIYIPQPVPTSARSAKLKACLRNWAEQVVSVKRSNPEILKGVSLPFHYLCFFWLVPEDQQHSSNRQANRQVLESGFEGERVKRELEETLSEDHHLKECCESPLNLAYYVDGNFIATLVTLIEENRVTDENYDGLFNIFSEYTYSQQFRKLTLSHLYNFESPEIILRFAGVSVMRLEASDITDVIGDISIYNFLHNHQTGDYFVITESTGGCPEIVDWLFRERATAIDFMGILQYFKDGIIGIDYTTPYFLPEWVNRVRKRGLSFVGEPKRIPYKNATQFYTLSKTEAEDVNRWWLIYQTPQIAARLEDLQNKLRQVLLRAGTCYESSIERNDVESRLINLSIALEALFSPADKIELGYKIALFVSLLVSNQAERIENFRFLREMYKKRSALFHGRYHEGNVITQEQAERFAGIIRVSVLRFLVLYLKGESSREAILDRLSDGVLNSLLIEQIRIESDPQTFIDQFQLPGESNQG
jgi:hypothetical protein